MIEGFGKIFNFIKPVASKFGHELIHKTAHSVGEYILEDPEKAYQKVKDIAQVTVEQTRELIDTTQTKAIQVANKVQEQKEELIQKGQVIKEDWKNNFKQSQEIYMERNKYWLGAKPTQIPSSKSDIHKQGEATMINNIG